MRGVGRAKPRRPAATVDGRAAGAKRMAIARARRNMTVALIDETGTEHEVALEGRVVAVVLRLAKRVSVEVASSHLYPDALMMLATPDESRDASPRAGAFAVTAGGGNVLHVRVITRVADAATSGHPSAPRPRARSKPRTRAKGVR